MVENRKRNLFSRLIALMTKDMRLRPRWKEERW